MKVRGESEGAKGLGRETARESPGNHCRSA
jgi:hypothetical protein